MSDNTVDLEFEQRYPLVGLVSYMIDLFDPYVTNHSSGVAIVSKIVGACAGIKEQDFMDRLEVAARIHDIGKMALPEAIRTKAGKYTDIEYFLVKQHTRLGWEMLNHLNGQLDSRIKEAVLHHHENWDGTGYPDGLKGKNIPFKSRIIRIADVYDAVTHSRGYRLPVSHEQALEILKEEKHFYDPEIFACFMKNEELIKEQTSSMKESL